MKRKLSALLITLVLIVSFSVPAFAAEERGSTVVGASISLYADDTHAFLVFTNLSNLTLYIGNETVSPSETITIGAFSGSGVLINEEKENIHKYYGSVSVTYDILLEDVLVAESDINYRINNYGSYDYRTNNCVHLAMRIWNDIVSSDARLYYTFDWNPKVSDADINGDGQLDEGERALFNYEAFSDLMASKTAYYDPTPSFNL